MIKIGVLALQGDVREHARALERSGATPVLVKSPTHLDDVDALIVPGGESTTIGKLLERFELNEPIRDAVSNGLPVYGTCAGAILLAERVVGPDAAPTRIGGLDVTVRRNAYGRQTDSFEVDVDIVGFQKTFRAVFIRAPLIEECGAGVDVLATHEGAPVFVRQGNMFASTFHPEMTDDLRLHEYFLEEVTA